MARFLPSAIEIAYLFAFHENTKCSSICVHLMLKTRTVTGAEIGTFLI